MNHRSFEDDVLEMLVELRDGVWGESVAERHHGFNMLLDILKRRPITRKQAQLISMIQTANLWFGRVCNKKVEEAVHHIRRQQQSMSARGEAAPHIRVGQSSFARA